MKEGKDMPYGKGFFVNRKTNEYIKIIEHAYDAYSRPDVFGTHDIQHLNPYINRDEVIIHVLKNGFIRVRDHKFHFGWQFYGNVYGASQTLKQYLIDNEIPDCYMICFTDFESGLNKTFLAEEFKEFCSNINKDEKIL